MNHLNKILKNMFLSGSKIIRVSSFVFIAAALLAGGFFVSSAYATVSLVELDSPSGGEEWRGTQTITWSGTSDNASDTVDLILSTDGTNFNQTIATVLFSVGTYSWTIPPLADNSLVRVGIAPTGGTIQDTSSVFTIDNTAPTTSISLNPAIPEGNSGWYVTVPDITLTCDDGTGSGCLAGSTEYRWDGGSWNTYTAPFPALEGEHTLEWRSQDEAVDANGDHNVESINSQVIKVDTADPNVVSYTLNGGTDTVYFNPAIGPDVEISVTADESVTWTTIRVREEGGGSQLKNTFPGTTGITGETTWDGTLSAGGPLTDAAFELFYTIEDVAGNTVTLGGPLAPHQIVVDTEDPEINNFTEPEEDAVYRDDVGVPLTFDLGTDTSELTCTYTVGDNDPLEVACESGGSVDTTVTDGFEDGRNDVTIIVTDAAGNSVSEGPISVVFDDDDTLTVNDDVSPLADFDTIQEAFSKATIGDTIFVYDGSYSLDGTTLTINKSITITGESEAGVLIDGSGIDGYGISITANDVTLDTFTLLGPADGDASDNYGIKASHISDFTMIGMTVRGSLRSEIDLNTVDGGLLDGVTGDGDGTGGVGIALSHSNDIILRDVTTLDNNWGGVGLFDTIDGATTDITFEGTNSFGETNGVYIDAEFGFGVSGITLPGFYFGVRNDTAGTNFTFLQETEADAIAFVLAFGAIVADSYIQTLDDGDQSILENHFIVADGMSIQTAIDHATTGALVEVRGGTYPENVVIDKSGITLQGAGSESTSINPTSGRVIDIKAQVANIDDITIEGFTLTAGDASLVLQSNSQVSDGYDGSNYTYRDLVIDMGGFAQSAIGLFDVDTVLIDNVIVKNGTRADGGTVEIIGAKDLTIQNSSFESNTLAIKIFSVAGYEANENITITNSSFTGNTEALLNEDSSLTIDAEDNWWDSENGPTHDSNTFNVASQGEAVSDNVDFTPWLDAAEDGDSFAPVTTDDPVDGMFPSIGAAVEAAGEGATVTAVAGTYTEDVTIETDNLTLEGAQAGVDARGRSADESEVIGSIEVTDSADTVSIDGFKFTPTSDTPAGVALLIDGVDTVTLNNNLVIGVSPAPGFTQPAQVALLDVTDVTMEQNDVTGVVDGRGANGVLIHGLFGTATIENNHFHGAEGGGLGLMLDDAGAVVNVLTNELEDNGDGVWIWNLTASTFDTITISGNEIHNNSAIGVKSVGPFTGTLDIIGNDIHDNETGVETDQASGMTITHNQIYDNGLEDTGVKNNDTESLDAERNWWGEITGPFHEESNPVGEGNPVSDNVDFSPFCTTELTDDGEGGLTCELGSVDPIASFAFDFVPSEDVPIPGPSTLTLTAEDAEGYTVVNDTTSEISLTADHGAWFTSPLLTLEADGDVDGEVFNDSTGVVTVTAILVGGSVADAGSVNFVPGDQDAPTITSYNPADGESDVSVNIVPHINFSEALKSETVLSSNIQLRDSEGDPVDATVALVEGDAEVRITPNESLEYESDYNLWVSTDVTDFAGNNLAGTFTSVPFTTEDEPFVDTVSPFVDSHTPEDGVTDVSITAVPTLTFSEAIDSLTATPGNIELRKYSDDSVISSTISVTDGNTKVLINPDSDLDFETQYYFAVSAGIKDQSGNALSPVLDASTKDDHEFTTQEDGSDNTGPETIAFDPEDNDTDVSVIENPTITFSEKLDSDTVIQANIQLREYDTDASVPAILVVEGGSTVHILPNDDLLNDTQYYFEITSAVTDEAGNALLNPITDNSVSFTTEETVPDTTKPVIVWLGVNPQTFTVGDSYTELGATASDDVDGDISGSIAIDTSAVDMSTAGTYTVTYNVDDTAGNSATEVTRTVVVEAAFDDTAPLEVTGISTVANENGSVGYATANDNFDDGWRWTFYITVPTGETEFAMKFDDFVSGGNTILAANNIRFYSAQASASSTSTTAETITADTYSTAITLDSDLEAATPGRQIEVTVEMKVPAGSAGGSYSAQYGIRSEVPTP